MTSTVSFKDKFKQAFSFFQWEMKSCAGTLTIYSILTAVFMVIILTLSIVMGTMADNAAAESEYTDTMQFANLFSVMLSGNGMSESSDIFKNLSGSIFQVVSFEMIYFMTIIFTVIYTIKVFIYLHKKRQADMYGSMPISRITLFFSKSATAFVFSAVPSLVFMGIAVLISLALGQPLYGEIAMMFANIIIGLLACISAYGLIAVCCGTTINSILMFIAVSIVYPMAAYVVRGVTDSFYIGSDSSYLNKSFLMNAFCPFSAYDGENIIYWLIFTVVCLSASAYLVKNRRSERAQSAFAYYLPCHILKVLVSFVAGMFLGVIFGSLDVFEYGYAGFVFGFILASIPAFIVCHLIFYHGFQKLIRTSIPLGILIVVAVGAMALINFDVTGYNSFVPDQNEIKSAGLIERNQCAFGYDEKEFHNQIKNSYADFDDEERISSAVELHKHMLEKSDYTSSEKFSSVWLNMIKSVFKIDFTDSIAFSYKMDNGAVVTRNFDVHMYDWEFMNEVVCKDDEDVDKTVSDLINDIVCTKEYQQKYSLFMNLDSEQILDMSISGVRNDYEGYSIFDNYSINYMDSEKNKDYLIDRKNILEAFKKDFEADTENFDEVFYYSSHNDDWMYGDELKFVDLKDEYDDYVCVIETCYNPNSVFRTSSEVLVVPKSYTNTVNALVDAGVINSDGTANRFTKYWTTYD